MTEEDAELVALIDGELDAQRKARLLARLGEDGALRQRYEAMRSVGAPIADGLSALAYQAPLERLAAALPTKGRMPAGPPRAPFAWRELVAGVAVGLLVAGAAALLSHSWAPSGASEEDWRDAIAEYAEFYNADTFAPDNPDTAQEALRLRFVSEKLGAALTPETLALPSLKFKTAQVFAFEGRPLAEIAFVDEAGQPILFCIVGGAKTEEPMRAETRGEMALASWASGGHDFMVIGKAPQARVADLAATLAARI